MTIARPMVRGIARPMARPLLKGGGVPAWVLSGSALDLDFAGERTWNSLVASEATPSVALTYTSPSPKMVYGVDGVLRYAPHNLLTYSEQFDNAAWSKSNATVTANVALAPDGTTTMDKLLPNTGTGTNRFISQSAVGNCMTVYAKAAELSWLMLFSGVANSNAWFDLTNGVVGTLNADVASASIQHVGNGVYRCVVIWTTVSIAPRIYATTVNGSLSVTTTGTEGILIWGAQVNLGPSALTYVPTTSAARYSIPLDHDPITHDPLGVLIEEQRTNLLPYSEQFDNAAWTKSRATVTANAVISPDGTTTADKLVPSVDAGTHRVYQFGITHGVLRTYAYTCYLKAGEYTFARLAITDATEADAAYCRFNLSDGTLDGSAIASGTFSAASASVVDVGNGWYRCMLVATCDATEATVASWVASGNTTAGANSFAGDTTSGIYVWGAQLEAGAFPTSYIPTVASQVTRAADQVSILTSAFAYNTAAGTVLVEGSINGNGTGNTGWWALDAGAAQNGHALRVAVGLNILAISRGASSNQTVTGLASPVAGTFYETAVAYSNENDRAISTEGAAVDSGSTAVGTINPATTLRLGYQQVTTTGGYLNGHIKRLTYFPTRKSNSELQALTA